MRLKPIRRKGRAAGCCAGTHCFLHCVQVLQITVQKLCNIYLQVYCIYVPNSRHEVTYNIYVCDVSARKGSINGGHNLLVNFSWCHHHSSR